jgi:two-component system chemotaxis sensor kinase CheA
VDHGIESPQVRVAAGKPAEGRLFLRAFHEGGQVNIEISDDGGGINVDRVKAKAVDRGLVTPDHAVRMSDREALGLIFAPGFSTAEQVTNVSGRGVGMDVVRTNIEKIGGTVDVSSKLGEGTTLKIKIPLTLAIIPALVITSGGERFAIPQVNLLELVRLEGEEARARIETVCGAPVYRLRGNLLPLAYLNREFGLAGTAAGHGEQPEVINIVVLQADGRPFGLVVDQINDTEEIVVKPLSAQLKVVSAFAGATIMGDGRVALILDVLGLAQHAGVVSEVRDRARAEGGAEPQDAGDGRQMLLLFGLGPDRRMAIPLSLVSRLEEFPRSIVERTGAGEVVQYRGDIMPLIRLSSLLGVPDTPAHGPMQVVVYSDGSRSVGLVVDHILDIVEERLAVRTSGVGGVVYGSAVIQERVTDLLDVEVMLRGLGRPEAPHPLAAGV